MSLYQELKRRNVIRVAIAYLAGSWLLVEIAETIFPLFGFGDTPGAHPGYRTGHWLPPVFVVLLGV